MLPIDRDLRVVWIGDEVVADYWRVSDGFHNNISRGGEADFSAIPNAAIALVQRLARGMGIDHAGFDLACVDGHWYAIEANVRFGNDALRANG
jgi:ribosomal protein S6--L-glutamate ligase